MLLPVNALNSVDLPTLGKPTMPIDKLMHIILPEKLKRGYAEDTEHFFVNNNLHANTFMVYYVA
jgi:hypothetical protein